MQAARRAPGVLALTRASRPLARTYATPVAYHQQEVDPQLGGYPQLPYVNRQRLPAKGWDDPQMRRNFGDTMHEYDEMLSMWGPDVPTVEPRKAARWFGIAASGFVTFGTLVYYGHPTAPVIRREYPYGGLVTELGGLDENKARTEPEESADEE